MRQLVALLQEWSPEGAEVPAIKKFKSLDLTSEIDAD